ncbi:DUF4386 domain-containing protein [Paenibacillus sp. D2_2]|uniref:DUF4386 domain-containing protein n=1 Tax=Paenibacillus sp. D2_2 TaxID=3073092 RepID=UPI0028158560|nr:DUF4386 domain-containing protein [Paenibacillus sp. D2_2]WMT40987.1 DUF4386 domain-containing protein [Paenibacillus sp. D2_2]
MKTVKKLSDQRISALTASTSLIVMALVAFFAYGFIHGRLVVQDNPALTFQNILASVNLFKAELLGWLIILICDVIAAWALYIVLAPIHKGLSLFGAWLRLIYSAMLGIAILNLVFVLLLSKNIPYLSSFDASQIQALMMVSLEAFQSIWSIGLIIFGGHLLIVGYLALRSGNIPRIISILVLLGGIGYISIHLCNIFLPDYSKWISTLTLIFTLPMTLGELGLAIWLLFKNPARESVS